MGLPIADRWFERQPIDADLTLLWEPHVHPLLRCNIWRLRGRDCDLLVDTGLGVSSLREAARDLFDKPLLAVATHAHMDHMGGAHEFDCVLIHAAEAEAMKSGADSFSLELDGYDAETTAYLTDAGYDMSQPLLTAIPHKGFDTRAHRLMGAAPTRLLAEGAIVDLGNRAFEVLHLPGHSPGSIGLWEARTGTLFSGDALYDGPLLDAIPGADIPAYRRTMERLLTLPVQVVHAGHDPSFGRERLVELARAYLDK
jgi:glyoxylase-like metal-dependent hydrolase (beta-lactamase superfamily II)